MDGAAVVASGTMAPPATALLVVAAVVAVAVVAAVLVHVMSPVVPTVLLLCLLLLLLLHNVLYPYYCHLPGYYHILCLLRCRQHIDIHAAISLAHVCDPAAARRCRVVVDLRFVAGHAIAALRATTYRF